MHIFLWWESQRTWNLWEHFSNTKMGLSNCQGRASSLEETCKCLYIEQKDLSARKTFQLDIESVFIYIFVL